MIARPSSRVLFGISLTPSAQDYPQLVEQVLAAERGGLDLVGIQDHPYQRRFLDTFALIADLLARTARLRIFPDVANLPLRGPTMIAKAAASLGVMSGGRFELGIGAGAFWDAVAGMGGPRRSARESIDALEEAMRIVRAALNGERVVRGAGPHYPVPGYPPGPPPAHRIELWVGAYRRRGLDLIARLGDGWVPSLSYLGPERFRGAAARLDDAAVKAGRDPRTIRRIYNVGGTITDGAVGEGPLVGPVGRWVETLTSWSIELGVDAFIFWPASAASEQVERFARGVVPAVRRALAADGSSV
ncbi:MAG TPA: LLM class flavin-dependent oxidoreductase [Candidatus Limnocylindria bacterium]|nr:LLM class flavin-dependent oxidoreductase [Candidatus Limnocylindria bacterium]